MGKKIAVLGPIPRDTITTHEGLVVKKYGGITNPTIALANLLQGEGTVYPITNIRQKDFAPIEEIFAPYKNIDLAGIDKTEDKGTVIQLQFVDQNKRIEKQTACMNPILPKHVKDHLDCDVFVFVPITDFEISLETLKYIKENSNATIIFDAHGPTNCMSINGNRHQKFWIDRDVWLPYIDVLKMNLEEAQCCWFKPEYELEELGDFEDSQTEEFLDDFGEHVVNEGTNVLIVTMDSRGCVVYEKDENGMKKQFVPSVPVQQVIDTTGCGDSFAGGLGYGYIAYDDVQKAAFFANALGAQRTQGTTFDVFLSLEETKKQIENNYHVQL